MNIVDRETFISLPEGTVFAEIKEKWDIGELRVKTENCGVIDFYETNFTWVDANDSGEAVDLLDEMWENPKVHYPIEKSVGRNGLFYTNAKYLIYDQEDIDFITETLNTLKESK